MIILIITFILGFLLHKLRRFTLQYESRLGDVIRYVLGLLLYIQMLAIKLTMQRDKLCKIAQLSLLEYVELLLEYMLMIAGALGSGVVASMLLDKENNE